MKWIIQDWTGKRLYPNTFESFEEGWAFVYEHNAEDEWEDIYVVVEVE